jgi:hypothetical protein
MGVTRPGIDRKDGLAAGLGLRLQYLWIKPAAGSATAVHAAIDISAAATGTTYQVTTSFTNPDFARPITYVLTDANAGITNVVMKAYGTLRDGSTVTETVVRTSAGTTNGSVPFATVTAFEYTVTSGTAGASDTISLGTQSTKLGAPYKLRDSSDIKKLWRGKTDAGASDAAIVAETVAGFDAVNQVITLTNAADGAYSYWGEFQSEWMIPVGTGT